LKTKIKVHTKLPLTEANVWEQVTYAGTFMKMSGDLIVKLLPDRIWVLPY